MYKLITTTLKYNIMKTSLKATIGILLFLSSIILLISFSPKGNAMIQWERDMEKINHFQQTGEKADNSQNYNVK